MQNPWTRSKPSLYYFQFKIIKDVKPPIYVAGSFTNPPWIRQEMEYISMGDPGDTNHPEEYVYTGTVELPPGEYEYKFCIGEDRWICDEQAVKVSNGAGDFNNVFTVDPRHNDPVIPRGVWKETRKALGDQNFDETVPRRKYSVPSSLSKVTDDPVENANSSVKSDDEISRASHSGIVKASLETTESLPEAIKVPLDQTNTTAGQHAQLMVDEHINTPPNLVKSRASSFNPSTFGYKFANEFPKPGSTVSPPDITKIKYIKQVAWDGLGPRRIIASQGGRVFSMNEDYSGVVQLDPMTHEPYSLEPPRSRRSKSPGTETMESGAPLLPHERELSMNVGRDSGAVESNRRSSVQLVDTSFQIARAPTMEDLRDPNLEVFPQTKAGILRRMERLKNEIPPDDLGENSSESDTDSTKRAQNSHLSTLGETFGNANLHEETTPSGSTRSATSYHSAHDGNDRE